MALAIVAHLRAHRYYLKAGIDRRRYREPAIRITKGPLVFGPF